MNKELEDTKEFKPKEFELKWQKLWDKEGLYQPDLERAERPFYNLMMFPYPSAEGLHVGNMYAFCGSDIYGRYMRMRGFDVFEPIGLDGFGIHSENYALKIGEHPMGLAKRTEANFYRQLHMTGNAYAWSNSLETYDPNYYKWTQWIFIQLFKAGLAYRGKAQVNWCPKCMTVLADEQVIKKSKVPPKGRAGKGQKSKVEINVCERCESKVIKKELTQWFFKITAYSQRLLDGLEKIDWSEKVKVAQRNWIGKSEGARILFTSDIESKCLIEVFTTRLDTIFGVTFVALAPEHPLVIKVINNVKGSLQREIREYIDYSLKKTEAERIGEIKGAKKTQKTGIFTGFYCENPLSKKRIPIYIADYVLPSYGTGAVMGVPAHDQRDWDFARKYKIDIVEVIKPSGGSAKSDISQGAFTDTGVLVNSGEFSGLNSFDAINMLTKYIEKHQAGEKWALWHLRDWIISRQRYWGPPIPMIFCESCQKAGRLWFSTEEVKVSKFLNPKHEILNKSQIINSKNSKSLEFRNSNLEFANKMAGWYPVCDEDLPVKLPYIKEFKPKGTGVSPLASDPTFVDVKCPGCGKKARRETDVSDTFLDSAWYFLRYLATDIDWAPLPSEVFSKPEENLKSEILNSKQISNSNLQNSKQFRNSNLEFRNFARRAQWLPVDMYIGGAEHSVLHLLYSRFLTMAFYDLKLLHFEEPFSKFRAHGLLILAGAKMSKSKGNVVNPDKYIEKFGADTLRCYLMFCGRFVQGGDFRDSGIEGMHRFLKRVWRLVQENFKFPPSVKTSEGELISNFKLSSEAVHMMHKTIKKLTEDIEELSYNTAIAALMEWVNFLESKVKEVKAGPAASFSRPTSSAKSTSNRSQSQTVGLRVLGGGPSVGVTRFIDKDEIENLLLLLAPFAPHMTEELWQTVHSLQFTVHSKNKKSMNNELKAKRTGNWSIHSQPWPEYDPALATSLRAVLVVEVDGKVRDKIAINRGTSQETALDLALASEHVKRFVEEKPYRVIYIEDKLINLVTNANH